MHTFSKLIIAATLALPMFAVGSAAHADAVIPQMQYPSVFWPDRDNVRQDAYAYYPATRGNYVRVNATCFYINGARTFAPGCRY